MKDLLDTGLNPNHYTQVQKIKLKSNTLFIFLAPSVKLACELAFSGLTAVHTSNYYNF